MTDTLIVSKKIEREVYFNGVTLMPTKNLTFELAKSNFGGCQLKHLHIEDFIEDQNTIKYLLVRVRGPLNNLIIHIHPKNAEMLDERYKKRVVGTTKSFI